MKTLRGAPRAVRRSSRGWKTFEFLEADIATLDHLYDVDFVVNFAAETHVDNSIVDASRFLHSNILGVQNLLELDPRQAPLRDAGPAPGSPPTRCTATSRSGVHHPDDPLKPSNPYSASKASADMLIMAWHRTHGVPYVIVRPTNNYGIGQYPEKLIPKAVKHLALGKKIPLHGDGKCRRNWLQRGGHRRGSHRDHRGKARSPARCTTSPATVVSCQQSRRGQAGA